MLIRIGFEIALTAPAPVPSIVALSTHPDAPGRLIGSGKPRSPAGLGMTESWDIFGNVKHRLTLPAGETRLWSDCAVEQDGLPDAVVPEAVQHPVEDLPMAVTQFLKPSRYCDSDALMDFAWAQFPAGPSGWDRVQRICDFVHGHIQFGYHHGRSDRTASQALAEGRGVCRDYAHLAVALCRAVNIPARYASGYLGDIGVPYAGPGDFCAWFEAYIGGRWYTFDARYNVPRIGRVLMVRGFDAGDAAMMTSFGSNRMTLFRVWCEEMPAMSDAEVMDQLERRPEAEALLNLDTAA
ncbi:transglutaminase family protein [Pseudooceanicola nanhaiensis]|uniref:Transglutaminase n=1 Tax=Pseudooceanicola nanhaiensis TaxID=375761 RepID=A0A917SSP5_9RHOB|nr:transglutaminase family protein [Pseudooceanicola nanhaiensis]GGL94972.1 transglutaminase [Pseudooceanicola nanhaiensis]